METLIIRSTIKREWPNLPFAEIKKDILGARYELSLTFIGRKRAQRLNKEHRKKNYVPNVLSFPLSDQVGDIFICPDVADREAEKFNLTQKGYIAFLFIHGCLHLKGHDHGATMDKQEQKYLKKYNIS